MDPGTGHHGDAVDIVEHDGQEEPSLGSISNDFGIFPEQSVEEFSALTGVADEAEEIAPEEAIENEGLESDPAAVQAEEVSASEPKNSSIPESENELAGGSEFDRNGFLRSKTDELVMTLRAANGPPEAYLGGFSVFSPSSQKLESESRSFPAFSSSDDSSFTKLDPTSLSSGKAVRFSHGTLLSDRLEETIIDDFDLSGRNVLDILGQPESRRIHLTPGAPLDANGNLHLGPNDVLNGNGEILGNVILDGLLSPGNSPGIVIVDGDFTVDPAGTIQIEIGGTGGAGALDGHDQIQASGNVALAGTLDIKLLNGFLPAVGDRFEILTYGGLASGAFTDASGLFGFGDGSVYFDVVELPDRLRLEVRQAPGGGGLSIGTSGSEEADALGKVFSDYFSLANAALHWRNQN